MIEEHIDMKDVKHDGNRTTEENLEFILSHQH